MWLVLFGLMARARRTMFQHHTLIIWHFSPAILSSLDGRLIKLEKSILPLYTSTQVLTRRGNSESVDQSGEMIV